MGKSNNMAMDMKKTRIISIRCTSEMEKKIKAKADQLGVSTSEFIMDELEDGLKRITKHDRNHVRALVETQESLNNLISSLEPEQNELKQKLIDFSKGMMKIWQC